MWYDCIIFEWLLCCVVTFVMLGSAFKCLVLDVSVLTCLFLCSNTYLSLFWMWNYPLSTQGSYGIHLCSEISICSVHLKACALCISNYNYVKDII